MIAKLLAEALTEVDPPWDLHEARGRRRYYTGLLGPDHQAALAKGYVDLGLVDPEIVLNPENVVTQRRFPGIVAGPLAGVLMNPKFGGVGYVRDPEGFIAKLHIEPERIATIARTVVANTYQEQIAYDVEAEDWESQTFNANVAEAVLHARVSSQPVQGRTGGGYKFVMKPPIDEIERRFRR